MMDRQGRFFPSWTGATMRIYSKGEIVKGLHVTGFATVPVYLLDAPQPVLFDAGWGFIAHLYEQDIRAALGKRGPAFLFLTHSHFDHVGAARYLKDVWPEMKVAGSQKVEEVLRRPKAVQLIRQLNRESVRLAKEYGLEASEEDRFEPVELDLHLAGDEVIQVGQDQNVHVLHTPGHTWDFMSYWIPERRILIGSEAVGSEDSVGYIHPEFLVDYDAYRRSLERLASLDAEVLCPGHQVVVTGSDVKAHLKQSIQTAEAFVSMVERFLKETGGDVEQAVVKVKDTIWAPSPYPKQPEASYLLNTTARVKNVLDRLTRRQIQSRSS